MSHNKEATQQLLESLGLAPGSQQFADQWLSAWTGSDLPSDAEFDKALSADIRRFTVFSEYNPRGGIPMRFVGEEINRLARADLLVTPDSGPMHIANAMGTKVLGLHAASNPARSGPYSDRRYCVDRYDDAARKYLGKPAVELKWGTKIEHDGVMDLVTVDDAIAAFERYRSDAG